MKILDNVPLNKLTTVHIGGIAKRFLIPESLDELINASQNEHPDYFIGGGSNLLISEREFDLVVDLRSFNTEFEHLGNGQFKVGASLRLQSLIGKINQAGYGGIEYLFSVPGLVGGAVAMNAGRGKQHHQSISDHVVSVDVVRNGQVITLSKKKCEFSYRNSVLKNNSDIILSCILQFPEMSAEESTARKEERIELCRKKQDTSKPNFGSVFCESNARIMNYAKKHKLGAKVHFSGKTPNWIVNEGGTFEDALTAIKKVELLHKLFFKKCKREVIVWE